MEGGEFTQRTLLFGPKLTNDWSIYLTRRNSAIAGRQRTNIKWLGYMTRIGGTTEINDVMFHSIKKEFWSQMRPITIQNH